MKANPSRMANARRKRALRALVSCALITLILSGASVSRAEASEDAHISGPHAPLQTLSTVDNSAYQLSLRLIDFPSDQTQNAFLDDFSGYHKTASLPDLLSGQLGEDGYPANREGASMASLFADSIPVNHLFSKAELMRHGVWCFDSTRCFASLHGDDFIVYDALGTIDTGGSTTLDHGQFLPFNDLTPGLFSTHHPSNQFDALNHELADDDPLKGEPLYAIDPDAANHYFALEMEAAFYYPTETNDREFIASFSADDDLWVYIDDILVIDLGGVHSGISGFINFSTGTVSYRDRDGKDQTAKLYKLFQQRYEAQNPDAQEQEKNAFLDKTFHEDSHWQMVFREDSIHTLKLFYMERGAGASNLTIRFNLPVVEK